MVLVTGGTGLLGSHLLYDLLNSGEDVRAIKRNNSNTAHVKEVFAIYTDRADNLFSQIKWIDADVTDYYSIFEAMDGITDVYHCAAIVSFNPEDRDVLKKVNTGGTANIVNSGLAKKIRKLCYVSTIAALGRAENNGMIDESTYWKTSKKNSNYALSKYNGENEVWRGINEGLNAVIVNPSVILGLDYNQRNGTSELFKRIKNGLMFYPIGVNGFVDVRDVSKAIIKLMKNDIKNERFIVTSENLPYKFIFDECAKQLRVSKPAIPAYKFLAELYSMSEKFNFMIKGSKPFITKETVISVCEKNYYTNKKIKDTIEIDFIPIGETVMKFSEIFLKHLDGNRG